MRPDGDSSHRALHIDRRVTSRAPNRCPAELHPRDHRRRPRGEATPLYTAGATATTFAASGPFAPSRDSNSTRLPSARLLKPSPAIELWCTNRSFVPSSGVMNPYPLLSLNHFTVPLAIKNTSLTTH